MGPDLGLTGARLVTEPTEIDWDKLERIFAVLDECGVKFTQLEVTESVPPPDQRAGG